MLRSDSDNERGRVRAQTYPTRPSPRLSENIFQPDRDGWFGNAQDSCRTSSPSPLKKKLRDGFGSGLFLQNKRAYGGSMEGLSSSGTSWSKVKSTRTSPAPTSCESGGSGSSRSGVTPRGGPRASRRRHHHRKGGWGERGAPVQTTRQQRLVTSMFALVVVLGSIQIIALIVHPPRGGSFGVGGLSGIAVAGGTGDGSHVRRRVTGGFQDKFLRASGVSSNAESSAGGLKAPEFDNNAQRQEQGLSLSHPRAFEMVAADMGHLKDTVEKLDLAFRETMGSHSKDLAAVLDQLGLEPSARHKRLEDKTPAKPNNNNDDSTVGGTPPSAAAGGGGNRKQRAQLQRNTPPTSGGGIHPVIASAGSPVGGNFRVSAGGASDGDRFGQRNEGGVAGGGTVGEVQGERTPETGSARDGGGGETEGVGAVWNAYQRGKWVNGQWIPKVLPDDTVPDLSDLPPASQQRRVLLLSEKRSGGHAVGQVLNADPRVFYVADPCRMGGGPEALGAGACSLSVSRLLACQPTVNDIRNLFSFSHISRVFSELEGLRRHGGGTAEENDEAVRAAVARQCRLSSLVVVKETRLAEVAPRLSTAEFGVEFLHIVRDPRATIHGLAELWETSTNTMDRSLAKDCSDLASRVCAWTETKLKDLTGLGKHRFRVLKYEMFVEAPIAMTKSVYTWLELGELPQEVVDTIRSVSMQEPSEPSPGTATWRGSRTTLGRFEWATRWAVEMPAFRRQQVQYSCQSLLVALGYDEPDPPSGEEFDEEGGADIEIQSSSQDLGVVPDDAAVVGSAEAAVNGGAAAAAAASSASGGSATASIVAGEEGSGRGKGWRTPSSSTSSGPGAAEVVAGEAPDSPAATAAVPATA
eukprot:g5000.t1